MKKVPFIVLLSIETFFAMISMGLLLSDMQELSYLVAAALFTVVLTPFFLKLRKTEDEAKLFFKTLLTEKEAQLIAQRLLVAQLLEENKVYSEIVAETGASSATVSRVKRAVAADRDYFDILFKNIK